MLVTPACYASMTKMLMQIAPVCAVLEGGYHLSSLEQSVAWTLKALLDDPCPPIQSLDFAQLKPCLIEVIDRLIFHLSDYWKCMQRLQNQSIEKIPINHSVIQGLFCL